MGHRIDERAFTTREAAEKHQQTKGTPGYSEIYGLGIREYKSEEGETVYVSKYEEYYG
jgi:hypothetical protein